MNDVVAPNVKTVIAERCLKQSAIAEKAGYTRQQLNSMLKGRKVMKDTDILRIAEALGVGVDVLFKADKK